MEHTTAREEYPQLPKWLLNPVLFSEDDAEVLAVGATENSDIQQVLRLNRKSNSWEFKEYVGPTFAARMDVAFLNRLKITPDLECKKISEDASFLLSLHIKPELYQDYNERA